ncbi:MAG: hypothetical protein R2745_01680 [Vicinamibacterales bacterium]
MDEQFVTEDGILRLLLGHLRRQFPKPCPACGRVYANLRDYVQQTAPLGPAISYDLEETSGPSSKRLGTLALAKCPCGDTLALGTDGLSPGVSRMLLDWVEHEAVARQVATAAIVEALRQRIRQAARVMGDGGR